MDSKQFNNYVEKWARNLPELNVPLDAWGRREVDISDPNWMMKLAREPRPLDTDRELRKQFLSITKEMVAVYLKGNGDQRARMRELLNNYEGVKNFLGAQTLSTEFHDATELFVYRLVCLSMRDLGKDTRDEIVSLDSICKTAEQAGIDIVPHLKKIAQLSGNENKYGMGSMQDILLRKIREME